MGACNKDGDYYALRATPARQDPAWTDDLGAPAGPNGLCVGSATWDSVTNQLFLPGGTATTIGGTSFGGSISSVDPATGAYLWRTGLPCGAVGSPSADSAGVLAVGTWSCPSASDKAGAYLVSTSTGAIIKTLPVSGRVFSQPVFAQGNLFVAGQTSGIYSFAPKTAGHRQFSSGARTDGQSSQAPSDVRGADDPPSPQQIRRPRSSRRERQFTADSPRYSEVLFRRGASD